MAIRPLTIEQEAALAAAASGPWLPYPPAPASGKTTLMVEAVWRDLEHDRVPLERIFVAAYNRAAAAHLVTRLQTRFADAEDGRGPARVGLDLSAAWVGTLHSLAGRIVREHPFAAGVDPEFGELDQTESTALMEQALDEAMHRAMEEPGFLDLVSNATSLRGLREATRHVYERLRAAGQGSRGSSSPTRRVRTRRRWPSCAGWSPRSRRHPKTKDAHREVVAKT